MGLYGRWVKLLGALVCVGTLFALWRFTPLREIVTADAVRHWAETFGRQPWAPLAILLAYTPASVIMFPRPLITLAATVAFGPWLGALYALGGIELAALSGYFAGRGVSRDRLRRFGGPNLNALSARLRSGGLAGHGVGSAAARGAVRGGELVRGRGARGPDCIRARHRHRHGAWTDRYDGVRIAGRRGAGRGWAFQYLAHRRRVRSDCGDLAARSSFRATW